MEEEKTPKNQNNSLTISHTKKIWQSNSLFAPSQTQSNNNKNKKSNIIKTKPNISYTHQRSFSDFKMHLYTKDGLIKLSLYSIKEEDNYTKDIISLQDSLLDEQLLQEKKKKFNYGFIMNIITQFLWAIVGIQLKTYQIFFQEYFSINSIIFWRSIMIAFLGYLMCIKKKQKIIKIKKIKYKKWFFMREFGNYFVLIIFIYLLSTFRVSTVQCILACHPLIILLFSIFIIEEPFYLRYIIGLILSFLGSILILINETQSNTKEKEENNNYLIRKTKSNQEIFIMVFFTFFDLIILSCSKFSQKMMCKEKLPGEVQNFYLGMFNAFPALFYMIYEGGIGLNFLYIIYAMSNGVLFYFANYFNAVCFNNLPVATFLPLTYFMQVFTFILGWIFLGEKVYFNDIFGSLLIIGFQVYNVWFPRIKITE